VYDGAIYRGETFSFPNFNCPPTPDEAAYYRAGAPMDRTYEQYEAGFGFDFEAFAGKTILDLGAGRTALFGREAAEHGITVFSINPNWRDDYYTTCTGAPELWQGDGKVVAGIAQELPFRDESFDGIVSLWGIPTYLPGTKGEYTRAFTEINRVLKPEGVAIMYPLSRTTKKMPGFDEVLKNCFDHAELVDERGIPKLFVQKSVTDNNRRLIDYLRVMMDRPTETFLV
jgi:SAM-dependent methyltransferase